MDDRSMPLFFYRLLSEACINKADIINATDGFFFVYKSLSDILSEKGVLDFPDSDGTRLACSSFFDDWFLYAVPRENDFEYSLLKLREQEHDARNGKPADGDMPGVTVSFVSFQCEELLDCLQNPTDENIKELCEEINRVVVCKGQRHHKALKRYFMNPKSEASYIIASTYTKRIAALAVNGYLEVPEHYKEIVQQNASYKKSAKFCRLPNYIELLNERACKLICDNERIFIKDKSSPTEYECAAILATHTGNTSVYSFAAEVEYHARFLTPLFKIKIPFFGKSIYESAIRADMTVGDTEFEGPAPFYRSNSKIVKRQYILHYQTKENHYD